MQNVIQLFRRLTQTSAVEPSTDAELLDRFFRRGEESAFAAIIQRHGAMVYGVCLRVLNHRQNAEDAFQATFLSLVRKGQAIRRGDALSVWLYRVAFRLALTQRGRAAPTRSRRCRTTPPTPTRRTWCTASCARPWTRKCSGCRPSTGRCW